MNFLIVFLIGVGVIIAGIVLFIEFSKTSTNGLIQLSVNAETTPYNTQIHTPEQFSSLESQTLLLDNSTLEKIPVLENAINKAFDKFIPPPFNGSQTFTTEISQSDADTIISLAGARAYQLPETETSDTYMGGNFTTYATAMEFKFNNFFYHVVVEKTLLTQTDQSNNAP
jgi:hypothetical protein